jgi:DNA polymerase III delta subunit
LKGEGSDERKKLKDLMDMYMETIDKARFTTRIFLPLHRQLRNLYRQNRDLQSQIRKLKVEL